jgi:hypothetical protein
VEFIKGQSSGRRICIACGLLVLSVVAATLLMHFERGSTADQSLDKAFNRFPQLKRQAVARFAGQINIDGRPPGDLSQGSALFVSLHRKQHDHLAPPLHTLCDSTGHFAFSTYSKEDGVAVGSYIVTLVKLRRTGRPGRGNFGPPDGLKNLYNDPEKNAQKSEFSVDLEMPGKTDVHFDLAVEGQEPIETPGPRAITKVGTW